MGFSHNIETMGLVIVLINVFKIADIIKDYKIFLSDKILCIVYEKIGIKSTTYSLKAMWLMVAEMVNNTNHNIFSNNF